MPLTVNERKRGVLIDEVDGSHISHAQYFNQKDKDAVTNKSGAAVDPADVLVYGGAADRSVTTNTTLGALQPAVVVPNEVDGDDTDIAVAPTFADGDQHWAYTGACIVPAAEIDAAWSRYEYLRLSATADKFHPTGVLLGAVPPMGTVAYTLNTGAGAGNGIVALLPIPVWTPKHNWTATAAPAVTNDVDEGYDVGSLWLDTTAGDYGLRYRCTDNSDGAAVWILDGRQILYNATATAVASIDKASIPQVGNTLTLVGETSPATDGQNLHLRLNNYSGASDYAWAFRRATMNTTPAGTFVGDEADAQIVLSGAVGSDVGENVSFTLSIPNFTEALGADFKGVQWSLSREGNDGASYAEAGEGRLLKSEAISRVTLLFSGGNIANGRVLFYIE